MRGYLALHPWDYYDLERLEFVPPNAYLGYRYSGEYCSSQYSGSTNPALSAT